jgi:hypothetical protein
LPGRLFNEKLNEFDRKLYLALEHFDVGLNDPTEPAALPPSWTVAIGGDMVNSAIQQGSPGATQNVTINVADIREALANYEAALGGYAIPANDLATIQADIATLKAQLAKEQPSPGVLKEIGKSLRTVTENVASSGAWAGLSAAGEALLKLLG